MRATHCRNIHYTRATTPGHYPSFLLQQVTEMAGIKVSAVAVALAVVVCGGWLSVVVVEGVPQYGPPPHPAPTYKQPGRPYNYAYSVNDEYKGLRFSADETSDGNAVKGSYQVALPDGRYQNVDYNADHQKGYNAYVTYTGEAQYPHPAPSYQPAPAPYRPAPAPYRPPPQPYKG